jgi:TPR repeat protein
VGHARELLSKACTAGIQGSCTDLSKLPNSGALGYEELCTLGSVAGCLSAGDFYAASGADRNLDKATEFYNSACMRISPDGCTKLEGIGDLYRLGQGVAQDFGRARQIYRLGCATDRPSCDRLDTLGEVEEQQGGASNQEAALENYDDACGFGSPQGCADLWRVANASAAAQARNVWQAACYNFPAVTGACTNLGVLYENGLGGPKDSTGALQLYTLACSRGDAQACTDRWYLEGAMNQAVWEIQNPTVTQAETTYPEFVFQPYDQVYVQAGGCVQTGGRGLTWKRYVNPSGDNSDRLYHGRIMIPGRTLGLQTFPGVIGKWLSVPTIPHVTDPSEWDLRLGYDDNNYGDNGYYSHDNGTQDQCKGVGNAWVTVTVQHHSEPLNQPQVAQLAPMDLWWTAVDDNVFPLNPMWGQQFTSNTKPDAGVLCDYFQDAGDHLSLGTPPCTTQAPTVDAPDLLANGPVMFAICQADLQQSEPLKGSSVRGHVNWGVASFTGKIYFDDFNVPPFSSTQIFSDGDGDYDWALIRDDEAGVVAGNTFEYHGLGNHGLTLEFNSSIPRGGTVFTRRWIAIRPTQGTGRSRSQWWTAGTRSSLAWPASIRSIRSMRNCILCLAWRSS